jgi:hypothetical protein
MCVRAILVRLLLFDSPRKKESSPLIRVYLPIVPLMNRVGSY